MYLPKSACVLTGIDASGHLRKFSEDRMNYNYYYNLQCLLNGYLHMVDIIYPEIQVLYDDAGYLKRLTIIGEAAEDKGVKLLPIKYVGSDANNYIAYINAKERIKALTNKYFVEVVKIPPETDAGKITEMPYISGVLFGYKPADIRGYYLRFYLLKGLPDRFKKPLEEIEEVNGNKFVQPDEFYDRRYNYVKKEDNFADFDRKLSVIRKKALEKMSKVSKSKKFERFAKRHVKNIINYKFNKERMFSK